MKTATFNTITRFFVAAGAVAVLSACSADEAVAPLTPPDLATCQNLQAPATTKLVSHLFATGVQIYRWNGTTWDFISPSAVLFADAAGKSTVGIHCSGPTWEGFGGSKVVGAALANCTPDANAIPWLLLSGTSDDEAGVFHGATHIQRVNTVGGRAPVAAGTAVGQVVSVAYATEYFFYAPQ